MPAANFHPGADLLSLSLLENVLRGGQVLNRNPQRLEQRDLVLRCSSRGVSDQNLADLAHDVPVANRAFAFGNKKLTRFIEG